MLVQSKNVEPGVTFAIHQPGAWVHVGVNQFKTGATFTILVHSIWKSNLLPALCDVGEISLSNDIFIEFFSCVCTVWLIGMKLFYHCIHKSRPTFLLSFFQELESFVTESKCRLDSNSFSFECLAQLLSNEFFSEKLMNLKASYIYFF